ncbi:hypothetical protein F3Y22_tig00110217pilonHSYRG00002 [Hibiscus syriacus]|uniref:Uncharacterized protein n=1 Tax=Hibiscus syriacus TaxID=106335 RepID=A0A6A3B9L3_HIBSY|nr:hypothetical protein F3Y22_tig00110217pilonHSYRG00002 [Hibiscus syriacus]
MSQNEKTRGVTSNFNPQSQYQYGTFQGVANYYPPFPQQPPPRQPFVGLPHPFLLRSQPPTPMSMATRPSQVFLLKKRHP